MNPVEEFLQVKEAGLGDAWKALKSGLTLEDVGKLKGVLGREPAGADRIMHQAGTRATQGATLAGMMGVAGLGAKGAEELYGAVTKGREHRKAHEAMLSAHPSLREENPEEVDLAFRSVRNLAPSLAGDPLAAGSVVRNLLSYGRTEQGLTMPPDTAKMLTETQKNLSGGRPSLSPMMSAFEKGISLPGAKPEKAPVVPIQNFIENFDPSITGMTRATFDPNTDETLYKEHQVFEREGVPGEIIGHHGGPFTGK